MTPKVPNGRVGRQEDEVNRSPHSTNNLKNVWKVGNGGQGSMMRRYGFSDDAPSAAHSPAQRRSTT